MTAPSTCQTSRKTPRAGSPLIIALQGLAKFGLILSLLLCGCSTPAEKAQEDAYKRQKKAYKELEKKRKNFDRESFYIPVVDEE